MPLAFLATLTLLVFAYAASKSGVFLRPINLRHMLQSTAPAALVAMAQLNVLLMRGIDVSVGSLIVSRSWRPPSSLRRTHRFR